MKDKLLKLVEAMYNLNRSISFNNIALEKPMNKREIILINRCIGEWIEQLKELAEMK